MVLNDIGIFVRNNWLDLPRFFENVSIDEFVVMPNHFHGIITITRRFATGRSAIGRSAINRRSTIKNRGYTGGGITGVHNPMGTGNLGDVIRHFKAKSTYEIRYKIRKMNFSWENNYYERWVRNNHELKIT